MGFDEIIYVWLSDIDVYKLAGNLEGEKLADLDYSRLYI